MAYAVVAAIVAVVAAGVQVYSAEQQAEVAEDTAKYNNQIAKTQATNAELENAEAIKRERARNRRQIGEIRARLAAGGTLTSEGAPLAILGESAENFELGIQDAARASSIQAANIRAQGAMSLWEGTQQAAATRISGYAQAAETVSNYTTRTKRY